jgi:hypothetical protein
VASQILDDLEVLEKSIRLLQIEWEKFFGGVEKKPPTELKTRVEAMVRRYSNQEIRNNTERFRYQNLASRYNVFSELWMKRLRAMEEGRVVGMHGARAPMASSPSALALPSAQAAPALARPQASSEFRVKDPAGDDPAVRRLFDGFLEARQAAGETAPVKYESFQKIINQQATRILTEKGAQAVDFRLETKDGKVSLKAKPVRGA